MPDEVIADLQHSGGARAAAVFLSAHVLQFDSRQTGDIHLPDGAARIVLKRVITQIEKLETSGEFPGRRAA
jgi:hypothetical protein